MKNRGLKYLLTLNGWQQFFSILSQKEKIVFFVFLFLTFSSLLFLGLNFYFENTKIVPAKGGIHTEGVVGFPRFINPILAPASDVDRDLTNLVFSGLMRYDKNNQIVPNLAEKYQILEEGKIFEFYLRENLIWSDNKPLTAADVVFTINAVQNPALKSPIRAKWLGVEVEKISDLKIRFKLNYPSSIFLENTTLEIMPKHIWQDISPEHFSLSVYNLKPVGSGPYKVNNLIQDDQGKITSLELIANPNYWGKTPYIPKVNFLFFNKKTELIKSAKDNQITGFSLPFINQEVKNLIKNKNFTPYHFFLPRYFAIFFNLENQLLAKHKVRQALNYGTNKEKLITEVLAGQAKTVNSPILPEIFGLEPPLKIHQFDPKRAKLLLEEAGFKETNEDGIRVKTIEKRPAFQFTQDLKRGARGGEIKELQRCLAKFPEIYPEGRITDYFGPKTRAAVIRFQEKYKEEILAPHNLTRGTGAVKASTRAKLNQLCHPTIKETIPLKLSLTTVDQPFLNEVASQLRNQWQELGVMLEIKTYNIGFLKQEIIKPRNYEMLLFGNILGAIPDPFPFWHSTQIRDPGLNLSLYENRRVDELLEQARQTLNEEKREKLLEEFQNILIEDAPAIFLFNPNYLYFVSEKIRGISEGTITDPSKRFRNIENWYIETKRI